MTVVHTPQFTTELAPEILENTLKAEGYPQVWIRQDKSGFLYPPHIHPVESTRVVLAGSMEAKITGQTYFLCPGDRLTIFKNIEHTVTAGPQGCTFVIALRV